ncbi:esterase/lipase family protein [Rhodococcus gannanensis]|uniref:Esterase/lipase family protein n=1 Tax=Rhodococcus gannanensis TaxID=1960308 RepID=A0ABW4P1E1_9NOCA
MTRRTGVVTALVIGAALVATPPALADPGTGSVDPVVLPAGDAVTPPIDCAAGSRPVVVLPGADGTVADTAEQWATVTDVLRGSGLCPLVFQGGVVNGKRWAGNIPDEAGQLATFVRSVQDATGSSTVDIVAHSAGSVVSNYYLKVLHGSANVTRAVFLAPEGRDCDGAGFLAAYGIDNLPVTPVEVLQALPVLPPILGRLSPDLAVALQLAPGSEVHGAVFADGTPITQPGVTYAVLATANDGVATPAGGCSFIDEPGVTNVLFEDAYPNASAVDHSTLRSSPEAASWVVAQLGR